MAAIIQRNFSGGELAPAYNSRVDMVKYATGARTLRNTIVRRFGGLQNRAGTPYVEEIKDSTKTVRLYPLKLSSSLKFMLEFGDDYIRFIKDGEYVTNLELTITGITNAAVGVVTYTGTDPSNGDQVKIAGIVGAIGNYLNGRTFIVANVNAGANTFELKYLTGTNVNTTLMGAYGSAGTANRIYTLTTSIGEEDLASLQFALTTINDGIFSTGLSIARSGQKIHILEKTDVEDYAWSIGDGDSLYSPGIPAPANVAVSGTDGTSDRWVVTAIELETFVESLVSLEVGSNSVATSGAPRTISWDLVEWPASSGIDAYGYNIYKFKNGLWGFVGFVTGTEDEFTDNGIEPDINVNPTVAIDPIDGDNLASTGPAVIGTFQQRYVMAAPPLNESKFIMSSPGLSYLFKQSFPSVDDDMISARITGAVIKRVVEAGRPIIFTEDDEYVLEGDSSGLLTPGGVNPKKYSSFGCGSLEPLVIDGNVIFVQQGDNIIRDFGFDIQVDGYRGNDLTTFAGHLFEGHTIVSWAYQKKPNYIIWAVRDDGVMLGFTYIREHQIWAWHRHDTDGLIENVAVMSDGAEDTLYLVVKRTIGGVTKRYIEKMASRYGDVIEDYILMDSAISYDGRNLTAAHTMTLSGGTTWAHTETLTLTSSTAFFASTDVGNAIHLVGSDGDVIRILITAYTSSTVVSGTAQKLVPVAMRAAAISEWSKAVDEITGLWHLEGKSVSILADGFVLASPNNDEYDAVTVTNGAITLERPYAVIRIGLPYISDVETLNLDSVQGETLIDKRKLVGEVYMQVEDSRGIWAGSRPPSDDDDDPLEGLDEYKAETPDEMDDPVQLQTDTISVKIKSDWNNNGRVFVRQVDPVPLSILSITPKGYVPFRG